VPCRTLLDPAGRTVWRWDSGPFGTEAPDEDPDGDGIKVTLNLRLPGQYYDAETGLHYNGHRDYDPATGRYVEPDPIGLAGGLNVYAYVANNPLNWVDPLGLNPFAGATVGGAIGGPVGAAIGAGIGSLIGVTGYIWYNNQATKTPNTGDPDSVHENPGSGQERKYGKDGKPEYDIDWDHDHGQGIPHAHNWENGKRGPGLPISPIPRGRKPSCP
jgi:RHS repeat-associated protein